jgi:2-keto-4-pentenoate hydratase
MECLQCKLVDRLVDARQCNRHITNTNELYHPSSLEEALLLQDRVYEKISIKSVGWFLGCVSPSIQKILNINEPYSGRLLSTYHSTKQNPIKLEFTSEFLPYIEAEFIIKLKKDLPMKASTYTIGEVLDAIEGIYVGLDIVTSHFNNWPEQFIYLLIADNGTEGTVIYGDLIHFSDVKELANMSIKLYINDSLVRQGQGYDCMGNPINVLQWLANQKRESLYKGQIISLGSCVPMYKLTHNAIVTATFGTDSSVCAKVTINQEYNNGIRTDRS